MKEELKTIRKRIAEIKQELSELGAMRPGAMSCQYHDRVKKTGANYQLSYSHRGKSHTKHVRPDEISLFQEQVSNYKRFKSLMTEWIDLCIRECEVMLTIKRSQERSS
jgi:hypothetical protein